MRVNIPDPTISALTPTSEGTAASSSVSFSVPSLAPDMMTNASRGHGSENSGALGTTGVSGVIGRSSSSVLGFANSNGNENVDGNNANNKHSPSAGHSPSSTSTLTLQDEAVPTTKNAEVVSAPTGNSLAVPAATQAVGPGGNQGTLVSHGTVTDADLQNNHNLITSGPGFVPSVEKFYMPGLNPWELGQLKEARRKEHEKSIKGVANFLKE